MWPSQVTRGEFKNGGGGGAQSSGREGGMALTAQSRGCSQLLAAHLSLRLPIRTVEKGGRGRPGVPV